MGVQSWVDVALRIPLDWLIRALVLTSMLLQLLLVICGARRYRSSSLTWRLVVWVAYNSADAVAISALGTMMHYARNEIYGIWAPLLLLHLGGPDAITAYSITDNELWLRHGFTMIYQVLVTAYVIYLSAFAGHLLVAAILLIIVGSAKYAERTASLAFASYSQIVSSTQPDYVLMKQEEEIAKDLAREVKSREEIYIYPLMGEKHLSSELQSENEHKSWSWTWLQRKGIVTIHDVWKLEKNQPTDDYMLCLSYSLFKMYRRRFAGLYFHEGARAKTRKLFFNDHLSYVKVFRMVEIELKYMYDFLFSKSSVTAFSLWAVVMRFLSSSFLAVAGFLIFTRVKDNVFSRAQRIVMYVLLSVAFAVEFYQLCRILVSDWTMVWLICTKIKSSRQKGCVQQCILKMIETAIFLLRIPRELVGNQYWKNKIQQYSVIDTCLKTRSSCIWKVPEFFVPFYIRARHVETKTIPDALKKFIFEKLKDICSPEEEIARCRERVYAHHQCLFETEHSDLEWASDLKLDDIILAWHIATAICTGERALNGEINFELSGTLSRYCAYLLLSHPNLLPLHPDTGKVAYMKLHYEIVNLVNGQYKNAESLRLYEMESSLGTGTKLARNLLRMPREQMWKLLGEYWAALLLYIAVYNKAAFHAECLSTGEQFLTQVWVLLGHMGCGEQSDSAVTKKMEDKSIRDKEEEENRKKEEMRRLIYGGKIERRREGKRKRKKDCIGDPKLEQHVDFCVAQKVELL